MFIFLKLSLIHSNSIFSLGDENKDTTKSVDDEEKVEMLSTNDALSFDSDEN